MTRPRTFNPDEMCERCGLTECDCLSTGDRVRRAGLSQLPKAEVGVVVSVNDYLGEVMVQWPTGGFTTYAEDRLEQVRPIW